MNFWLRKLTSRKLWLALAGAATGAALALGVDAGEISRVAGAVTTLLSVMTYVVTEGAADARRISGGGELPAKEGGNGVGR